MKKKYIVPNSHAIRIETEYMIAASIDSGIIIGGDDAYEGGYEDDALSNHKDYEDNYWE